jgi:hypothetical protein
MSRLIFVPLRYKLTKSTPALTPLPTLVALTPQATPSPAFL